MNQLAALDTGRTRSFLSTAQSGFLFALHAAADWLDGHAWPCLTLILAFYLPAVCLQALHQPLTNDEIYTLHIAQAPTLPRLLWLAREIDLHPPLHYLAERVALHIHGPRLLIARLPSLVAGLFVTVSIFCVARRRFTNTLALAAVALFWFTPALEYAWSNRPYMLWLAFLLAILLLRDRARHPAKARWAVPLLFALALAMVATQLLGAACLLIFAVAELVRAGSVRRMHWPSVAALLAPTALAASCRYQFCHFGQNAFPPSQLPSLALLGSLYYVALGNAVSMLCGCGLGFLMLFRSRFRELSHEDRRNLRPSRGGLRPDELLLLAALALLPTVIATLARLLHLQFWFRYGAASMPAIALLSGWLLFRYMPFPRATSVIVVAACLVYMVSTAVEGATLPLRQSVARNQTRAIELSSLPAGIPIVVASPMTFVEMSDREPRALSSRIFYLTSREKALRFAQYTLFENEAKIRDLLQLPSQVQDFDSFLHEHPAFYVVGDFDRPEVWQLRALQAQGLNLAYQGAFDSTYQTASLYVVKR